MSVGKVIIVVLATLVIFSTGLITGVVLLKQIPKPAQAPATVATVPAPPQGAGMQQFLHRVQGELDLSPEQHQKIEAILRGSQERTKGLARSEFGNVRDQIRGELTPQQKEKFERLLKQRQRRNQEMMSQENRPLLRPNAALPAEPKGANQISNH